MKKVRIIVDGRVQGVGFRWGVKALAIEMGNIYGRVWNNEDGTVEMLVEASSEASLQHFIDRVKQGPTRMARIESFKVQEATFSDYTDFRVI